jgi:hypothetical protein
MAIESLQTAGLLAIASVHRDVPMRVRGTFADQCSHHGRIRCRRVIRVLSVYLFLALCSSPALAQIWSPAVNVHPQNVVDENYPQIAITPNTTRWVAWMGVDPLQGDEEVFSSRWTGGEWGPPIRVNPDNLTNDRFPVIACGNDGTLWVHWTANDPQAAGNYLGLISRWTGSVWSWPDTLWRGGDRHDESDIAGMDSTEVWGIRHFASGLGDADIAIYHLRDHMVDVQTFTDPDSIDYVPSIAAGLDGSVWAAWIKIPDPPVNSRVAYTRYVDGAWDQPTSIPEPHGINRVGITVDRDLTPWIITAAKDPTYGIYSNAVWALRWSGSSWLGPVRISNPYASVDTSSGFQLSISKSPREYPAAVWLLANKYSSTRYDMEMSSWDGAAWSPQSRVGILADSALITWPKIDRLGNSYTVAYMRPVAPNFVSNVFTTSTMLTPIAAHGLDFRIDGQAQPRTITWMASGLRGPGVVKILRLPGSWMESRPPISAELVSSTFVAQLESGSGQVQDTTVLISTVNTYWLSVTSSAGEIWSGPKSVSFTQRAQAPILRRIWPNPSSAPFRVYGQLPPGRDGFIEVVDVRGRLVASIPISQPGTQLVDGELGVWDGKDSRGRRVSSGIYLIRISSGGSAKSNPIRVILMR